MRNNERKKKIDGRKKSNTVSVCGYFDHMRAATKLPE